MPLSLLLTRLSLTSFNPKPHFLLKLFSTSSPDPTSSLSSRLSFVFDQIDALERDRLEKDQTLERIRAWRQSKTNPPQDLENAKLVESENGDGVLEKEKESVVENSFAAKSKGKREVEVVHPWPEWIELVERLIGQNYFDHRRRDEDRLVNLGIDSVEVGNEEDGDADIDVSDFKSVQTACLNFGKDRFDILRSLSRQDIQHLVGFGCPSVDRKVVFSAKALRKHLHLDEGDVCSNCSLRSSCDKGFLLLNKEDEARTIDVMRILLTYGFDSINGSVANKSLLKQKTVKTAVRKVLHDVVKLSAVPIDPNLPPPVIKRPPPKVKQPPPTPKRRVGRDDIEMKKGDWLCPKCDFMNFAKNTVCLQCDAKRPKRQLLPGEWECPGCNFLNYRRNMSCFHCECKRPPDTFVENKMEDRQPVHRTRLDKIANRAEVSNAWNFDFDDDESDGADVAAFEYADSAAIRDGSSLGSETREGKFGEPDDDLNIAGRFQGAYQREQYQSDRNREKIGFDDFDDEDDIDSYELETENSPARKSFQDKFSQVTSDSKDVEVPRMSLHSRPSTSSQSQMKTSRHKLSDFEDDELDCDSDEEHSARPKWKSSHAVDAKRQNTRGDMRHQSRRPSFGSDEELDSDAGDDFGSRGRKESKWASGRKKFRSGSDLDDASGSRGRKESKWASGRKKFRSGSDLDDASFSDFQSDGVRDFRGNKSRGDRSKIDKRGNMGGRRSSWDDDDDFERSSHGNYGTNRRFRNNSHDRQKSNNRGNDSWNNKAPNRAGFQGRQQGRSHGYDTGMDKDFGELRNSRRVNTR